MEGHLQYRKSKLEVFKTGLLNLGFPSCSLHHMEQKRTAAIKLSLADETVDRSLLLWGFF